MGRAWLLQNPRAYMYSTPFEREANNVWDNVGVAVVVCGEDADPVGFAR